MSETKDSLDLTSLEKDYDILGEYGGQTDSRTFTARRKDAPGKRREDANGVLITVVRRPEGDEGNALSHLAADSKRLASSAHRRLIPVIEGRWLGDDAFALVTQRTQDETLAQKIATREAFSTPRVAAILREINGLLEWAREHDIVHRAVTANRVFLEPKTDRVRVSFSVAPIPRVKAVDAATADARTIVRLGMAMLLGADDPMIYEAQPLADLRGDLPVRLYEAATTLLDEKRQHTPDEVHSFISLIGMAEPLFIGEDEAKRLRADVLEEQRVAREEIANNKAEFEQMMADQRAAFEAEMAKQRAEFDQLMADAHDKAAKEEAERQRLAESERDRLAREKAEILRQAELERERLAKEKTELQRAVTAERQSLVAKTASMEKAVAERRAELERAAEEDRKRIAELRTQIQYAAEAELEARRQKELDDMEETASALDSVDLAPIPFIAPVIVPLEKLVFDNDSVLMRDESVSEGDEEDIVEEENTAVSAAEAPLAETRETQTTPNDTDAPKAKKKRWFIAGSIFALLAVIGMSAVALNARGAGPKLASTPAPAPTAAATTPVTADPAAAEPLVPLPSVIVDSSAGGVSQFFGAEVPKKPVVRKPKPVVRDTLSADQRDSMMMGDPLPAPGFLPRPRRDTTVKRDTRVRPDTIPQ